VVASVFTSGDELYLADNSGHATRLHLKDKSEERRQTDVVDITADGGDVATAYDVQRPADPSVVIDRANGTQERSPNLGAIAALRFGPCDGCMALLGTDRQVKIWHGGSRLTTLPGKRPVDAIAGRRGRLMTVRDGYLE